MTREQMRDHVMGILLQDPLGKKYGETQINTLLDLAVEKVWRMIVFDVEGDRYVEESSAVSIVAGTAKIAWPSNTYGKAMIRLQRVERVDQAFPYDLDAIRKDDRHRYTRSDRFQYPAHYYPEAPSIVLVPEPELAYTDALVFHGIHGHGTFAEIFAVDAAASEDATVPRFPATFHEGVPIRAAMMALGYDETSPGWLLNEWQEFQSEVLTGMGLHEHEYGTDTSDH